MQGKGAVQSKIIDSFNHPHVVSNLHDFLSSVENKGNYFEKCLLYIYTVYKDPQRFSKYPLLCSTDEIK